MNLTQFLILVLAWFLYRLAKSPRNPALWAVVACIAFHLLGSTTGIVYLRLLFGELPASSTVKLVMNLALNISRYALMLFFLLSAGGTRRRAQIEGAVLGVVCAAMTTAVLVLPPELRDKAYPTSGSLPHTMSAPGVAPFYLIGGAYTIYATIQTARWALRYANESQHRARLGLRIAAAGLGFAATATAARTVVTIVRWTGHPGYGGDLMAVTNRLVPIGTFLFLAGVLYVGLAARLSALRVWLRHRRTYHELRPLWEPLHTAFPEGQLDRAPTHRLFDRISPWRIGHKYWRRVIEIRDGLLQISPHLVDLGYDAARPAEQQADTIRRAVERQRAGTAPQARTALTVAEPSTTNINDDVNQLVRLSQALAQKGSP
ncbi:hypothetical protein NQK81_27670 [Amycolatopsis roodepoortensis]|uniref:MAB_1171c family putative transporter n=1 Tax=Amycolatopsis roodepoortensis TaxID=700274 RepID=UPI00214CEB61|nr:MAB_1171c family putative transporter [Amycolatopsis roodepoortensis]UUV28555.1 hypothetical protein NQK81_27670 [Amycolatopsis roodepoortensis]